MNNFNKYKYLSKIDRPADLKQVPISDLSIVCDEVRDFMIETITQTGGHFGSGLGAVELITALHYVYDTPKDKIVFDVGHQSYPHKILTGRKERLHTIRKQGGISGFLKPSESEYDAFGAGHASTSISAALGMATARDLCGEKYRVLAVIGDGALTGGMAYEALNNCGVQARDITVILNDNNVSIDVNVSAMSKYFNNLLSSQTMQKMRENIWQLTGKMETFGDRIRKAASRIEGGVKAIITPGILFEAFGFNYFGPIDGHNVQQLVRFLRKIKDMHGPILLHVMTNKGQGYLPAEHDIYHMHAIEKIDLVTGKSIPTHGEKRPPKYSKVFGTAMVQLARENSKIVGITAAMGDGTGLDDLSKELPKQYFDVGIAEEHAVTFAAGLAKQGITPVVAIYSTFLQRAYDQIQHDCALPGLHVVFALDRAGLVGNDGPTHHGILDIPYLRSIPGMVSMAPKDEQELRDMLNFAINDYKSGPISIRFPRGGGMGTPILPGFNKVEFARSETLITGKDIAIIAVGNMVKEALMAADSLLNKGVSAEVINARFIKPIDEAALRDVFKRHKYIVTIEDGQTIGGFGSAVLEFMARTKTTGIEVLIHGLHDKYTEHGKQSDLQHDELLDAAGIEIKVLEILNKNS